MASINEFAGGNDSLTAELVRQINLELKSVEKFHQAVNKFLTEPQDVTEHHLQQLMNINRICSKLGSAMNTLHADAFPATPQWIPDDTSLLDNMTFLRGRNPWSFVLTYNSSKNTVFNNSSYNLTKLSSDMPAEGTFLGCLHHEKIIRGILLEVVTQKRVKILDIDSQETRLVSRSSLYYLPEELSRMHALSLHCSILDEDEIAEKLWSEDLATIFHCVLKEYSLSAIIIKSNDGPTIKKPKQIVELIGTNDLGQTVNLSKWLIEKLIPDMKKNHVHKEELISFLEDESLDPLEETPSTNQNTSSKSFCRCSSVGSDELSVLSNETNSLVASRCADSVLEEHSLSLQEPLFKTLNEIALPGVGVRAVITIKHVLKTMSFFSALEDKYSSIMKDGVLETHSTLMNRMNDPSRINMYVPLKSRPLFGQLVAFLEKGSGKWVRGVISLVSGNSASVHNPDSSQWETVQIGELRALPTEDSMLPYQVVETFLHGIEVVQGTEEKAKLYFIHLTRLKNLHICVRQLLADNKMSVDLFTDGHNVSQALVASGNFRMNQKN